MNDDHALNSSVQGPPKHAATEGLSGDIRRSTLSPTNSFSGKMFSLNVLRWRAAALVLFMLTSTCSGQGNRRFGWKFNSQNGFSTSLPTCQAIPILVQPFNVSDPALNNVTGVPPYFMMAIPTTGTPRVYPIGSDPTKLAWTVDFPPSTELILSVIDSNNTAGGVPADSFKVVSGQNDNCVAQPPIDSTFKLSVNVTGEIATCAPWGVTVVGGVPPYNFTLAQIRSPVVTNVTGTQNDDELVYIMRGDQGQRLFVAASDATGKWANGVGIVTPKGSDNVDCIGGRTVTGNSTEFQQQLDAARAQDDKNNRNKTIAIAVPVAIVSAILIALAAWFLIKRRRKQNEQRASAYYTEPKIEMSTPQQAAFTPYADYEQSPAGTRLTYTTASNDGGPGSPTVNTSSAGSRKAAEAGALRANHFSTEYSRHSHARSGSVTSGPSSPGPASSSRFLEEDELVIQHRDAGGVVRELPPPYADRPGASRSQPGPVDAKLAPQN